MIKLTDILSERELSAKEEKIVKALKKTGKFKKNDPALYAIAASKAEGLDPVGKEDDDINNDGKVDKTDKYLATRRKAVSTNLKEHKLLLEKYVRVAIKKAIKEAEEQQKKAEKAMYLIYRFPGLKKVMEDLMSPSFGRFVTDMKLVAPKPTTFSAKLINEQDFGIIYNGRGKFTVKVAGKKYDVQNLAELERAQQAISNVLELNYGVEEKAAAEKPDAGAEAFSAATSAPAGEVPAEIPTPELPAEETPEEETPPAEA